MATLPDDEAAAGLTLHARMLAGDPVVFDEIYMRYLEPLQRSLRGYIARKQVFLRDADFDEMIQDAITEALVGYHKNPHAYKPNLRSLSGYLQMSALGDFKNLFAREMHTRSKVVQIGEERWNTLTDEGNDLETEMADRAAAETLRAFAAGFVESDDERTVLRLLLESESKTDVFARALGLSHLSPKDQQAHVNKIKERLSKRLKRSHRGGFADERR